MKKIIQTFFQTFLPLFILSSQVFAIAGFGAYGNYDLLKYPSGSDVDGIIKIQYDGFDNAGGFGFLFYIDAIPMIDLEADLEFIGKNVLLVDDSVVACRAHDGVRQSHRHGAGQCQTDARLFRDRTRGLPHGGDRCC